MYFTLRQRTHRDGNQVSFTLLHKHILYNTGNTGNLVGHVEIGRASCMERKSWCCILFINLNEVTLHFVHCRLSGSLHSFKGQRCPKGFAGFVL